jgi:hypothetical protein
MTKVRRVDWQSVRLARANLALLAREHPELTTKPSESNRTGWENAVEDIMGENDEQIVVRLPGSLLKRLDAYAERLRHEMAGPKWQRSDVVRLLLTRALDEAEPPKKGKR